MGLGPYVHEECPSPFQRGVHPNSHYYCNPSMDNVRIDLCLREMDVFIADVAMNRKMEKVCLILKKENRGPARRGSIRVDCSIWGLSTRRIARTFKTLCFGLNWEYIYS
ncbi:hypothetical protein GOP47_0008450 [Adiantum capillus-veneris]|uniref:Uncharacterized protein n=1 Tax=Adiantum capillus-veneris TaxID=13818 RepID=A0A9D4UYY8_ADICA|nr:hypothetical protein GOP47_0008450 [Adiantum capillus-veneris]